MNRKNQLLQNGTIMPTLIVFMVILSILAGAIGVAITTTLTNAKWLNNRELSLNIADSGINYYLWHLNHDHTDVTDGQGLKPVPSDSRGYGPFTHEYRDAKGRVLGEFTLYIKPDSAGSTISTIRSTGRAKGKPETARTIEARMGAKSFSEFAVASNTPIWFGRNEESDGPIRSNNGVKMDGKSNGPVGSALSKYVVPPNQGSGAYSTQNGVWCDPHVTSPVNCNTRNKSQWYYPADALDFNRISSDLCNIKKTALSDDGDTVCSMGNISRTNSYIPYVSRSYDINRGYLIHLNKNSYDLYRMDSEYDSLVKGMGLAFAMRTTLIERNIPIPEKGVIFVEDNVWLETPNNTGFDGRVTIAAARLATGSLPAGYSGANIVFTGSVIYSDKYSGRNVIGGVAQNNVEIAPYARAQWSLFTQKMEIHGAYIAQKGGVRYREKSRILGTSAIVRLLREQELTFFGSIATNGIWTWLYESGSGIPIAGFKYSNTKYDENLLYSPPPSFPITNTFNILSWREVVVTP